MTTLPTAGPPAALDLSADLADLLQAVCDVESVSGAETRLADAVEAALSACAHLEVLRDGDAVVARTHLGRASRVVVAGHLDTVPLGRREDGSPNLPTWRTGEGADAVVHGRGTCDMKGGVAVALSLAASLAEPTRDVTWVFYDHEEVEAELNGLGRLAASHPDWLAGDVAVLGEPTSAAVEGGCNGTLRVEVHLRGVPAHSARPWRGRNAVHAAAPLLALLAGHDPGEREVDGLVFRQSLQAVGIRGGTAGNVVPDACVVTVNHRFAPDRTLAQAEADLRELLAGYEVVRTDGAEGARPGLDRPAAAAVVAATGEEPRAKLGWTDVARFSALGVPAVNLGPGDPLLAHADDERCPVADLHRCADVLRTWLTEPQKDGPQEDGPPQDGPQEGGGPSGGRAAGASATIAP
ncbi:succinyl-diaminopimelate desuccinylase [Pseudokineococcus sp. 5B2Z-1]|uniref:succinyl-diaminopimelate desuccinylase n=1 Tax=Pseudokineococcus sp. 5B2Z-1 TaxID=3132744 RepID=UPI0030AFB934